MRSKWKCEVCIALLLKDKTEIVLELKEKLKLEILPRKIETYDISNISGEFIVAGMCVMTDGIIKKNLSRRFKIKGVFGQDDPKCMEIVNVINGLRTESRLKSVTQLLTSVYVKTQLLSIFSAMQDGEVRLENLQTFFKIVSDYESNGPKELSRLLDFLDTADAKGLSTAGKSQDKGAVTIMSIHKSKGLEFPVVFLCGLSRGFNTEDMDQIAEAIAIMIKEGEAGAERARGIVNALTAKYPLI